jgi:hypothetical protein
LRGQVAFFHQMTGFSVSFAIEDDKLRKQLHELIVSQNYS